ncbi:MAG TPA: hypothetical protein VKN99_02850 [Polyangia bacterium]|nr:hypothetical protein [Polyangia bacterium]
MILAREAPVGVVFRRGPSKWVRLYRWDTRTDRLEPGQWFHGRLYERRCDLSPDGSLLIYFAAKHGGARRRDPRYTYAWTAISKPPWLSALALWPKGDCWHGGGLFLSARSLWLNHRPEVARAHPDHKPKGLRVVANPEAYGEDEPVYWRRLARDGWVLSQPGHYVHVRGSWKTERPLIWSRRRGVWNLHMVQLAIDFARAGGPRVLEYRLTHPSGRALALDADGWADWDATGRLVYVRRGRLYAAELDAHAGLRESELADLSAAVPQPAQAPTSASRWTWKH